MRFRVNREGRRSGVVLALRVHGVGPWVDVVRHWRIEGAVVGGGGVVVAFVGGGYFGFGDAFHSWGC